MSGCNATEGEKNKSFTFLLCVCLHARGCSVFLCRRQGAKASERLEWFQSVQAEHLPSAPWAPMAAVHAQLSPALLAVGLLEEDSLPLGRRQLTNVPLVIVVGREICGTLCCWLCVCVCVWMRVESFGCATDKALINGAPEKEDRLQG